MEQLRTTGTEEQEEQQEEHEDQHERSTQEEEEEEEEEPRCNRVRQWALPAHGLQFVVPDSFAYMPDGQLVHWTDWTDSAYWPVTQASQPLLLMPAR